MREEMFAPAAGTVEEKTVTIAAFSSGQRKRCKAYFSWLVDTVHLRERGCTVTRMVDTALMIECESEMRNYRAPAFLTYSERRRHRTDPAICFVRRCSGHGSRRRRLLSGDDPPER
jgi:hypothetical protein